MKERNKKESATSKEWKGGNFKGGKKKKNHLSTEWRKGNYY